MSQLILTSMIFSAESLETHFSNLLWSIVYEREKKGVFLWKFFFRFWVQNEDFFRKIFSSLTVGDAVRKDLWNNSHFTFTMTWQFSLLSFIFKLPLSLKLKSLFSSILSIFVCSVRSHKAIPDQKCVSSENPTLGVRHLVCWRSSRFWNLEIEARSVQILAGTLNAGLEVLEPLIPPWSCPFSNHFDIRFRRINRIFTCNM